MRGEDFIKLAKDLGLGAGEAHWRSAVSRAYYGAFHEAVQLLRSARLDIPKNSYGHDIAYRCLNNSGDAILQKAATQLLTLKTSRIRADYRIDEPLVSQKDATLNAGLAEQFLLALRGSSLGGADAARTIGRIVKYLIDNREGHVCIRLTEGR